METAVTDDAGSSAGAVRMARHRARRGRRNAGRQPTHGLYALDRTLRTLGTRALDGRSVVAKALAAWKADLIRDLGGDVSTQQLAVIELAVKTRLLLESVDAWLLTQPSLINARKKALLPAVRERQQLADSLARYMTILGLERRAKQVETLADILRTPKPGGEANVDG